VPERQPARFAPKPHRWRSTLKSPAQRSKTYAFQASSPFRTLFFAIVGIQIAFNAVSQTEGWNRQKTRDESRDCG
jgi:hypothetical protein